MLIAMAAKATMTAMPKRDLTAAPARAKTPRSCQATINTAISAAAAIPCSTARPETMAGTARPIAIAVTSRSQVECAGLSGMAVKGPLNPEGSGI
jgi:hypothetical protein